MRWFSKIIIVAVFFLFLFIGGYIGYLSALVDLDELRFIEQVQAVTDKKRLEKQLARAKSILEARRRAYLRKSQEFLERIRKERPSQKKQRSEEKQRETIIPEKPEINKPEEVLNEEKILDELVKDAMKRIKEAKEEEIEEVPNTIKEDEKDIQFFSDEVEVLTQMVARQPSEEEIHQAVRKRKKRQVSNAVRRLLLLADKQKQLIEERKRARSGEEYWKENPKSAPSDISVTVSSKDDIKRDLNPLHVSQITTALSIMPANFLGRLQNLYVVYGDPNMRRGMTGVGVVFMKGEELDFFRVLIHEFGHAYDLHREVSDGTKSDFYDGEYRLFMEDPSVTYYQFSWFNTHDRKEELPVFVSSYGMTDPFEDFAEAFALYILQGNTFVSWKGLNAILGLKYGFLNQIFLQKVFPSIKIYETQPYDVTMLPVDYEQLLK